MLKYLPSMGIKGTSSQKKDTSLPVKTDLSLQTETALPRRSAQLILVYPGNEFKAEQTGQQFPIDPEGTLIGSGEDPSSQPAPQEPRVYVYLSSSGLWHRDGGRFNLC